jgi:tRNA(Ile)-lysidine synthase
VAGTDLPAAYDRLPMRDSDAHVELLRAVESTGLIARGSDGVVLVSGGADSACLAAAATALCGPDRVYGVHLNYGLREGSDADERAARALCAKLRIDLHIERPELGEGNVQARARELRMAAAERLRARLGAAWIATGHTRSDLAETVLYRLAVSPGSRALLGMAPASGRLIRPLHRLSREQTRAIARDAGLPFSDDPTNRSSIYARNRIRLEILPLLEQIGPEVERNIATTHAELLEEAELLVGLADDVIAAAGAADGLPIRHEELAVLEPALLRLVLRRLAERVAGERPVRIDRRRAQELLELAGSAEAGSLDLGRGLRAIGEAGTLRFVVGEARPPSEPVRLRVPGSVRFADWELRAEIRDGDHPPAGPELATLDLDLLGDDLLVRAWREGDRIRPLGLGGSKSLQDLFTDSGVPRSLRRRLPVLLSGDRVAWVAGVAVSEEFRLGPGSRRAAVITARAIGGGEHAPAGVVHTAQG